MGIYSPAAEFTLLIITYSAIESISSIRHGRASSSTQFWSSSPSKLQTSSNSNRAVKYSGNVSTAAMTSKSITPSDLTTFNQVTSTRKTTTNRTPSRANTSSKVQLEFEIFTNRTPSDHINSTNEDYEYMMSNSSGNEVPSKSKTSNIITTRRKSPNKKSSSWKWWLVVVVIAMCVLLVFGFEAYLHHLKHSKIRQQRSREYA